MSRPSWAIRLHLDKLPFHAHQRDAAWRFQAIRLRQGPLDLRPGGLHGGPPRDGEAPVAAGWSGGFADQQRNIEIRAGGRVRGAAALNPAPRAACAARAESLDRRGQPTMRPDAEGCQSG